MRTHNSHNIARLIILLVLSLSLVTVLQSAEYGKIKGVVRDAQSGEPIIGAAISLVGTDLGAITDVDGRYVIRLVPAGVYTMKITTVGKRDLTVKQIRVYNDGTTEQNAKLEDGSAELEAIVVCAVAPAIDKFDVTSSTKISKQSINRRPVTSVDELLTTSGVVASDDGKIHVRGGKAGDVAYSVEGVNINNPTGGPSIPLAHGGSAIVNGAKFDAMFFENHGVNPFVDTEDDSLSTFAFDTDDASFILARAYFARGAVAPKDAVRTEEFVNHFKYNYQATPNSAFALHFEGAPSITKRNSLTLRIGVKARDVAPEDRKPANLVFVVDISGSMNREDRLELVKKALTMLVDQLTPADQVGIVVYGSSGRVILEPTGISQRERILAAINSLACSGATNVEEGIRVGYQMAKREFEAGQINRVILCSDGVANVGRTGPDDLLTQIKAFADMGITLSTIGFGMGNYNDLLMEKLGDKGDGHYAYVDGIAEAKRVFVDNLTGALQVVARETKTQVAFDPAVVRSYRLIGYENRDVADEDFRNDAVDGGEVGAGYEVTALYEIKLHKSYQTKRASRWNGSLGKVFIRYQSPDTDEVVEISKSIRFSVFRERFVDAGKSFRLAACAAEFAEILRDSYWARETSLTEVMRNVDGLQECWGNAQVEELMSMILSTLELKPQLALE